MSRTEEILTAAVREAAVLGEISLALAARRYRPGSATRWATRLRAAAASLDRLEGPAGQSRGRGVQ